MSDGYCKRHYISYCPNLSTGCPYCLIKALEEANTALRDDYKDAMSETCKLEAKLKRIEDRMKTIKAGREPPYANLLQRDRNMVHIVIEDLGQSLKENDDV